MTVLRDQRLFLGGLSLSSQSNSVSISLETDEKDRTALEDVGRRRVGGLEDSSIGASGFFDAGAVDAALFSAVGLSGQVIGVTAPDVVEGVTAYALQSMIGSYTPVDGSVGDLGEFDLAASADGPIIRGELNALRDLTATGVGAVSNLQSVQSGRSLYAALFVTALSAGATLECTIRSASSSGFGSATQRIDLGSLTETGAAWGVYEGNTSHAYFRPSFTLTGTDPSASVALILAVQ